MSFVSPLDLSEQLISERFERNAKSLSARILSAALRISMAEITDPFNSRGPQYIVERFNNKLDLSLLSQYKVILSKSEGCQLLKALGIQGLSDDNKFLNRYIDNTSYKKYFNRDVSRCSGRGNAKLVLTYGEITYFYTDILGRKITEPLIFPTSLSDLADEGNSLFPTQ
jgi:hypothetical protein